MTESQCPPSDDFIMLPSPPAQSTRIPPVFHLPKLNDHSLFEISVDELQYLYSSDSLTAKAYTQFCLDRIQAVNPYLEAVIETNPDAPDIARELDRERKDGGAENGRQYLRGPLHGIPVMVKDVGRSCLLFSQRPFAPSEFLNYNSRTSTP